MKNNYKKIIFSTLLLLLIHFATFSQTFIRYNTWTGASGCNIFSDPNNASTVINVPCTINGTNTTIPHLTSVGQPTYDNANKTVNLVSEIINGSQNQGTEYRITVNFKQGYSYKITITAARIMSQQTGANVLLRTDLNSGGSGSNNQCNGTGVIDANGSGNLKKSLPVTNSTFANADTNYVYDYPSLSSQQAYLMIAAIPPAASVYQTVLIRRIKIEETPPAASFSISPSISSMSCGATAPITFTINNNASTPGITGYTWNIGATPNGWIYNGNPAPASIPITATSLSPLALTPDCGKTLSSVSATVTANTNNYNTSNSATVSITQPTYSIIGNSSLCSGNTNYTLNGLVCNSSIAWTAPPSNLGTLSSLTTSPTTLTFGGTSGNFTLTANITSCGVATPVTLPVHVGAYTSSDYTLSGNNGSMYWCPNQTISFSVSGAGSSNYNWTPPTGWTIVYNGGSYVAIKAPSSPNPPTGTLSVSFTEPCGTTITLNKFLAYSSSACTTSPYTVTPNPASSYITIACASLQTYCNISAVQITDMYGTVLSSASWPYTNQSVQMPVYFLQNGTYIARTYSGTQWYSNTFMVQH
ncbi:MAG: hypothetical protein HYR66_05420 [Sphingobacteriales bacterium]|nr:hypothetical protein [Sphingobacteriales bacterium]MBI3720533.1 hypothetical protein [Sphingobacteriales bacterium]